MAQNDALLDAIMNYDLNKAVRELQLRHPLKPTSQLESIVDYVVSRAPGKHGDRLRLIRNIEHALAQWETQVEQFELHLDEIAAAPQPQTDPYVTAQVDKNGILTTLTINPEAFTRYTSEQLGQAVTRSLQAAFDHVDAKVRDAHGGHIPKPDRAAEPKVTIKATHSTGSTVTVDRWLRPIACHIHPSATTRGPEVLSHLIARLCRTAQERVSRQILAQITSGGDIGDIRHPASWHATEDHQTQHSDVRVDVELSNL
ncbi:hypothetical protein [Mycolicibacterium goodii]|uniref:Uncharacterized protein n=1 Tax=Mycolicibacterium goodii TaxID=134601 RepID=A0ABS6I1S5_MYCGD|nr:hypothetical protein [Mycolicibacterium goodii]MBU8814334.1 hypothetical protein [Mycolicibacterium goodii]MBU8827737.1 hypothetical protein [Mycolicibacterium goodii]MBU8841686.1 hypothetical protein [Mycolicibacterium goodii]